MTKLTGDDRVIIGIKGTVLALDAATGQELWRTPLKGWDFTTLVREGDRIFAAAAGEVCCLDVETGAVLWKNTLKGMGFGIVSIATSTASQAEAQAPAAVRHKREQDSATLAVLLSSPSIAPLS
jgi:outer membrane protein assembly factor BamB